MSERARVTTQATDHSTFTLLLQRRMERYERLLRRQEKYDRQAERLAQRAASAATACGGAVGLLEQTARDARQRRDAGRETLSAFERQYPEVVTIFERGLPDAARGTEAGDA